MKETMIFDVEGDTHGVDEAFADIGYGTDVIAWIENLVSYKGAVEDIKIAFSTKGLAAAQEIFYAEVNKGKNDQERADISAKLLALLPATFKSLLVV